MATDDEWYRIAEEDPEELSILSAVMGVTKEVSPSAVHPGSEKDTDM
jgi:hypothetical protein